MLVRKSKDDRAVRRPPGRRSREYRYRSTAFGRQVGAEEEIPGSERGRCLQRNRGDPRTLRRRAQLRGRFGGPEAGRNGTGTFGPRSGRCRFGDTGIGRSSGTGTFGPRSGGCRSGDTGTAGRTEREPSGPDPAGVASAAQAPAGRTERKPSESDPAHAASATRATAGQAIRDAINTRIARCRSDRVRGRLIRKSGIVTLG